MSQRGALSKSLGRDDTGSGSGQGFAVGSDRSHTGTRQTLQNERRTVIASPSLRSTGGRGADPATTSLGSVPERMAACLSGQGRGGDRV